MGQMAKIAVEQLERALANISSQPSPGTVARVAVREIARLTGASRAVLAFFDDGGGLESVTRYAVGESGDETPVLTPEEEFLRQAYEQGQPVIHRATLAEPFTSVATPCYRGDRAAGALGVIFPSVDPTSGQDTIAATSVLGSVAALVLENQRLSSYIQQSVSAPQDLSEQWLGLVEASQSDLIVVTDFQGRIVDANQVACRALGYTKHELLHRSVADFVPSPAGREDRSLFSALIERVLAGQITSFESAFMTKSGRVFPIEVRIRLAEVGGETFLISVASDLTERKHAETQLVQAERLHVLGEMAAGIVHDINNMLTAALGPIEVILASSSDPLTLRLLQQVQQSLLDSAQTVRRIQAFARQNVSTQFVPIDLVALANDVVEFIRPRWQTQAIQKGLVYDVAVKSRPVPMILGSSAELREALINLLNNALDAMPSGGQITISISEVGSNVQLQVTDTGVGMSGEVLQRIFDPFYTTKGIHGSGLGLSVVYGIVARHRGQINVESMPGQGTTFTLSFPVPAGAEVVMSASQTASDAPEVVSPPPHGLNILVVDDQPAVAMVLQLMLEMADHRVRVCSSGPEALVALHEERFDLVCTDINMPEMNGWEIAKAIKAEFPNLPVVFVTGWSESYDENELRMRGVDFLLHKPYQIHDVQELVSAVLKLRASPVSSEQQ